MKRLRRQGPYDVEDGAPIELIGGQLIVAEPKGSEQATGVEAAGARWPDLDPYRRDLRTNKTFPREHFGQCVLRPQGVGILDRFLRLLATTLENSRACGWVRFLLHGVKPQQFGLVRTSNYWCGHQTSVLGRPRMSRLLIVVLAAVTIVVASHSNANADPISVCTGVGCSTTNVSGSIVAGAGTVTVTLNNNLTNSQVVSVIQDVSAVYFQVSGYNGGAVSLASSNSTQSTNIDNSGNAVLAGAVNPTGWGAGHSGSTITVCIICAFGIASPAGPDQTLIGGTGSGSYPNANGSIAGNNPHNPFLAGTATFTLNVPGVTVNSAFSDVVIQFGTTATPPTPGTNVPEPSSLLLLGIGLVGVAAKIRSKRRLER